MTHDGADSSGAQIAPLNRRNDPLGPGRA